MFYSKCFQLSFRLYHEKRARKSRGTKIKRATLASRPVLPKRVCSWTPTASKNNHEPSYPSSSKYRVSGWEYAKLKIYTSELILGSYEHIPAEYVIMHCMIWRCLTLILLTWRIWWVHNNASKWQMGFNSVFKWLNRLSLAFWVQWVS